MMKLGMCASFDRLPLIKEIGYDYAEFALVQVAELSDEAFCELKEKVQETGLPVSRMNSMLPGRDSLYTEEGQRAQLAYLKKAYRRAAELGVTTVVFGSAGARMRPDQVPEDEAYQILADFLKKAAPIARENGIRIAIEPLRKDECNILNSVDDGRRLMALAGEENVAVLADLYHMMAGGEDVDTLLKEPHVVHTHIAEKEVRSFPKADDACFPFYEQFIGNLKAVGYEGGVSVEGQSADFENDAREAFAVLDRLRKA